MMTPEIWKPTGFFWKKSWTSAEGSLELWEKRVLYKVGFWKKHQQQLRVFGNSIMNQSRTNEMSENEKPILKKKLPVFPGYSFVLQIKLNST